MGCCDCGCDKTRKRNIPLAVWILLVLALLAVYFWQ